MTRRTGPVLMFSCILVLAACTDSDTVSTEPATDERGSDVSSPADAGVDFIAPELVGEWVFEAGVWADRQPRLTIAADEPWRWDDGCNFYALHDSPSGELVRTRTDMFCEDTDPAVIRQAEALSDRLAVEREGPILTVATGDGSIRFRSRDIVPFDLGGIGQDFLSSLLGDEPDTGVPTFGLTGHDASCPSVWSGHWAWRKELDVFALHGQPAPMLAFHQRTVRLPAGEPAEVGGALDRIGAMLDDCAADRDRWIDVELPAPTAPDVELLYSVAALRDHDFTPSGEPSPVPRTRGTAFAVLRLHGVVTVVTGMFVDADEPPVEWADAVERVSNQMGRTLSAERQREAALAEWQAENPTTASLP